MSRSALIVLAIAAGLAAVWPATVSADTTRHSGTVTTVDQGANTITIAEVGPWEVRDGETVITPRTVAVTPETEVIRTVRRDEAVPGAWPGGFTEVPMMVDQIEPGDFVTVEAVRHDGRLTAKKVVVAGPRD